MKTMKIPAALRTFLGVTFLTMVLSGCSKNDDAITVASTDDQLKAATLDYTYEDPTLLTVDQCVDSLPYETLSPEEEAALVQMREEEFLAHDVYLSLSQLYTRPVFVNISKSELTHTTAVKGLLDKYQLPDPAANHIAGVFTDPALQALYNDLVATGSQSLLNGLIVGATIEDLDIYDLEHLLLVVDNQDITMVFNNLMRGSRNHLRSFYANILKNGGTYQPQYISSTEFNEIINSAHEPGNGSCN